MGNPFQFQIGAIKSEVKKGDFVVMNEFQFQIGAIKRNSLSRDEDILI